MDTDVVKNLIRYEINVKMLTYVETRLRTNVGVLSCYFNQ